MRKLFRLKEWLSVEDAASHLSQLFGEYVSKADILQLALDGKLTLSVYLFNKTLAIEKKLVPWGDAKKVPSSDGETMVILGEYWDSETILVENECTPIEIEGVYDLTMKGAEKRLVEKICYQFADDKKVANDSAVKLFHHNGAILKSKDERYYSVESGLKEVDPYAFELNNEFNNKDHRLFYSKKWLPDASVFVVRTQSLQKMHETFSDQSEKPISTTERNSLMRMVIGMAIKGYGYDVQAAKSAIPKQIEDDLAELGIAISDDTVRKYLREAASTFLEGKPKS